MSSERLAFDFITKYAPKILDTRNNTYPSTLAFTFAAMIAAPAKLVAK